MTGRGDLIVSNKVGTGAAWLARMCCARASAARAASRCICAKATARPSCGSALATLPSFRWALPASPVPGGALLAQFKVLWCRVGGNFLEGMLGDQQGRLRVAQLKRQFAPLNASDPGTKGVRFIGLWIGGHGEGGARLVRLVFNQKNR